MDNFFNRVLFPLRSNAGWFQSPDLQVEIASRLKQCILIYDEILVEDGSWETSITENGAIELSSPPGELNPRDRKIIYERDIKPSNIWLSIQPGGPRPNNPVTPFFNGPSLARYKIDFYELMQQVGSGGDSFIKYGRVMPVAPEIRDAIKLAAKDDARRYPGIVESSLLREKIIQGLSWDLTHSALLQSSIVVDPIHEALLQLKSRRLGPDLGITMDDHFSVAHELLRVHVPKLDQLNFEQVIELRNRPLWTEFRGGVRKITQRLTIEPELLLDPHEYDKAVRDAIDREWMEEAKSEAENNGYQLVGSIALGVLSYLFTGQIAEAVGAATTTWGVLQALGSYYENQFTWKAFLLKASRL